MTWNEMKKFYPNLYQLNTRVFLTQLSRKLGRNCTLRDMPDEELDRWAALGFQWIWLLSVWQTGLRGQEISRTNPEWLHEFRETLPDLTEQDIPGSGFAITAYNVHSDLGGDEELVELRKRLQSRNLKLLLDFVPNHIAIDHPWTDQHPEFLIIGDERLLSEQPKNWLRTKTSRGEMILAHGRDPYFPGWPDTLQLNYSNPDLQTAMVGELIKISKQCDGVRCDMAMLVLPDIFERTWGKSCSPFWQHAIKSVQEQHPEFVFMAEVYWDLEWVLQQAGFSYTYDKRLYDRLKEGNAVPAREHFFADMDFQMKSARFLENHDEPRAAHEFPSGKHKAAAIITFMCPGLRFFHDGQLQGKTIRISPHLNRGPEEATNPALEGFYRNLLDMLKLPVLHSGEWIILKTNAVSEGNYSHQNYIGFGWTGSDAEKMVVVVNYSEGYSQAFLEMPFPDLAGKNCRLKDLFSGIVYDRSGDELLSGGLFLDEPRWRYYVFHMELTENPVAR